MENTGQFNDRETRKEKSLTLFVVIPSEKTTRELLTRLMHLAKNEKEIYIENTTPDTRKKNLM